MAQNPCVSASDIPIIDLESTSLSFTVSGITNDDLSSPVQGLQSIRIDFEHDNIADLEVFLTSPAGQRIQIIGPLGEGPGATDLVVRWNLTFIPCAETPDPDPLITDGTYSNNLEWAGLNLYNGFYHPHLGCFEDINMGTVNGTWTVDIVDGLQFDGGIINNIEIKFIDQEGLQFDLCESNAGNFTTPLSITVCEFEDDLLLSTVQVDNFKREESGEYKYEFIVSDFISGDIIDIMPFPDLRGFPLIDYQVCALSYSLADSAEIYNQLTMSNLDDFRDFIDQRPSAVCADLMLECMTVVTLPILDTLKVDTTLCRGGTFTLRDGSGFVQDYDEPGTYIRKIGSNVCDSLIILNINQVDVQAVISTDTDTIINCATDTITLGSSMSIVNAAPFRLWSTGDGEIIGDSTATQVKVTKAGSYLLEIINEQGCMDDQLIVIGENMDAPLVNFNVENSITCENPTSSITFETVDDLFDISWEGPDFSSSDDSIIVSRGGIYYFAASLNNGCFILDSVEVIENFSIPDFTINVEPIGCKAQLVFDNSVLPSGAKWIAPSGEEFSEQSPIVTEQGVYELVATSENGCIDTIPFTIEFDPPVDSLFIDGGVLSCNSSSTQLSLASDESYDFILWEGPNIISSDDSITVDTIGEYIVRTVDEENCPGLGSIEVELDSTLPEIKIMGRNFGCSEQELSLIAETPMNADAAQWSGPDFSFTGAEAIVTQVGEYTVTILGENGCTGVDTFRLGREEPFDVDIADAIFNCDVQPIQLQSIISIQSESIRWAGPNGFESEDIQPTILDTGLYILSVTGPDQCVVLDSQFVDIRRPDFTISGLDDLTLDCNTDSVQFNPIVSGVFTGAVWASEQMEIFPTLDPFVSQEGTYQLEIMDGFGCRLDTFLRVNIDTILPQVSIDQSGVLACQSEEVILTGQTEITGSEIVLWLGENGPLSPQDELVQTIRDPGIYTLRIFNPNNGCFAEDQAIITQQENTFLDAEIETISSCAGFENGQVMVGELIGGEGPIQTSLDSLSFEESNTIGELSPGDYTIYITDANGCTLDKEFSISGQEEIILDIGEDIEGFRGDEITVELDTFGLNVDAIDWFLEESNIANDMDIISFIGQSNGTLRVELISKSGCIGMDELDIRLLDRQTNIYQPNSFIAGEGPNSIFRIYVNVPDARIDEFIIYDRWGNLMYETSNVLASEEFGWDGRVNSQLAEQGVYVYYGKVSLLSGEVEELKGTLTLFHR